jgi:outer membrane protein OmpA-like peptidoglycan-associated protein
MIACVSRPLLGLALTCLCASCASVPPGPPPDIVRLQNDVARLHDDPRITENAGPELGNADAAVDMLARNARSLDANSYQQGVYISDKLVKIAEASARARYAEQRGTQLGIERDRLLADASSGRRSMAYAASSDLPLRSDPGEQAPSSRTPLMTMQAQLSGLESRVDDRGLVIRLGDFMFEPDRPILTSNAQRSLDTLALSMRREPAARGDIEEYGGADGTASLRAAAVRDYLVAHGVEDSRLHMRGDRTRTWTAPDHGTRRVDIVVRTDGPLVRQ